MATERVDVRHQRIAQLQKVRENRLGRGAIFPERGGRALTVDAQGRRKYAVAEPAREQLGIIRIIGRHRGRPCRIEQHRTCRLWPVRPLPAADVAAPIGHAACGETEPGRHLPLQRLPGRLDVRRPEQPAVALCAQIGGARQDQVAHGGAILRRPVRHAHRVEQREDVVITVARADRIEAAVGHQIGLGLVEPEPVEALAGDVVADPLPEPVARIGVGAVEQRARAIGPDRQAVDDVAVLVLQQPALARQQVEIPRFLFEARPDADDRTHPHRIQLVVHALGIGEILTVDVELAHARPVEPVEHHDIERQAAAAIPLGDTEQFLVGLVPRLALDEAERGLGRQRGGAGQRRVAGIDLVGGRAGDDEERHPLADFRLPVRRTVQAGGNDGRRRIVPDDAIALVGDHERHADRLARRRVVIVAAVDRAPAQVELAFLVLAEPVIMLVGGRREAGPDAERLLAVDGVRRHFPPGHLRQYRAVRLADRHRHGRQRRREIALHLRGRLGPGLRVDRQRQRGGREDIGTRVGTMRPAGAIGLCVGAIARGRVDLCAVGRDRHADDVGRIGLDRDEAAVAIDRRDRCGDRGSPERRQRNPHGQPGDQPGRPTHPQRDAGLMGRLRDNRGLENVHLNPLHGLLPLR